VNAGIFTIAPLPPALAQRVHDIQRAHDARLANLRGPHVTVTGSSGMGPIAPTTPVEALREAIEPIARTTPPIRVRFGRPERFPGTDIVVLPLDPHGPLRTLYERIATSGLTHDRARFPFTPHCTLNLYATLTPQALRSLMGVREEEPFVIDRVEMHFTRDPQPGRKLLELPLTG
jgi:2'-5' RNA ligase